MISETVEDALDDWEPGLEQRDSYPVLGIAIGLAVVTLVAVMLYFVAPVDASLNQIATYGIATGIALAVWATACWLTLRHAGWVWMAAALAILLATAGGAARVLIGEATAMVRLDVTTMQRVRVNIAGDPVILAGDPYKGPLTRLHLSYINQVLAERKRRDAALKTLLDEDRVPDPDRATIAADCEKYTRAKAELALSDQRVAGLAATFRQGIGERIGDATLRRETLGLFDTGYGKTRADLDEMRRLRSIDYDETAALCGVVVRHGGRPMRGLATPLSAAEQSDVLRRQWILRDAREKQRVLKGDTINRINARLELGGDTRF